MAGKRTADVYYLEDKHRSTAEPAVLLSPELAALDPGATLRAAREARGLSIDDLNRTTKISGSMLRALEQNQIEKLPAKIFTRGFLKAYAREVGLDPETTADRYLAHVVPEPRAATFTAEAAESHRPATRAEVLALDDDTTRMLAARQARRFGGLITVAAVFGLAAYVGSFNWLISNQRQQAAPANSITVTGEVAPTAGTPVSAGDATPTSSVAVAGPLRIDLEPKGPCWLVAMADGQPVLSRLLQAGDRQTIEVNDELVLRVGDPATLSFSINGQPGRSLGRAREPVNVRITKDNFREFLGS